MQNEEKIELFEYIPVSKSVIKLALPMILSSLTVIIYNMADTFFVGMLADPIQNAAITLAAPIMLAFNVISNLLGVGTASMMSRSLDAKDYKTVKQSSAFGFYGTLFSGLLFFIVYTIFKQPIMELMGVQVNTEFATNIYMFWTVTLGALPTILHIVMLNIIRAEGKSVLASAGVAVGCILNIILDPIFVLPWGLNMGASGAGCATFLSNCASCIFYFIILFKKREKMFASISIKDLVLNKKVDYGVCSIGVPASIQTLLNVTSMTILNNFTVIYGATAVAAMSIAQKLNSIPLNIALGGSQEIMPLISYTYASKNYKRMKNAVNYTRNVMLIFLILCSSVSFILAKSFVGVFMNSSDISTYGSQLLRGFSLGIPFLCLDYLSVAIFQAVGMGKYAFFFAIARKIILEIPSLIILNSFFPLYGLAYAQFVTEIILSIISIIVLRRLFHNLI